MMTNRESLIRAATVALTLVAGHGCSSTGTSESTTRQVTFQPASVTPRAQAATIDPLDIDALIAPASAQADAEPTPRNVNIFGEFDGQPRPVARAIGEANFQQHTYLTEGYDGEVSLDPTGKYIVFSSTRHSEHPQIYMQRVDGMSVTQLTSDSTDNAFPVFSPDGKQIAFCSTRAGNWDIYVMDIDGRNVVQMTSGPGQEIHPSFAPDGKRIAYCSIGGRSNQWELWTVDLESNQKRMIGFGLFPAWSPSKDKDQIAFQRARQRGSRWFSLWTLDLVDGEARSVTEVAVSTNAAIVSPTWSPDGRKLAFATIVEPSKVARNGHPEGQQDIWTVSADGTGRRRITDGNGTNASPFWAADNRVYFISDRGGVECVWSSFADSYPSNLARSKSNGQKNAPAVSSSDTREVK